MSDSAPFVHKKVRVPIENEDFGDEAAIPSRL